MELLRSATLIKHFLGLERTQQLVDIFKVTLGDQKLTGRDIEESHTGGFPVEMNRCQKVVLFVLENIVIDGNSGGDQFSDAPFDDFLGQFGVFELFTNGYPLTSPDQFGEIGVEGMVGKTGQFHEAGGPVGPACKGDAQNFCRPDGVIPEGLIEIAHPEKEDCIGVFGLDGIILPHQRRLHIFVLTCHISAKIAKSKNRQKGAGHKLPAAHISHA